MRPKTHGHAFVGGANKVSRTYKTWQAMKERCLRSSHISYKNYGGRGVVICQRWMRFENFLADMGERPPGMQIERKDGDKGYCKDNCRWATPKEQARNRRNNRPITVNGETMCISQWAERAGIERHTIRERLKRGWTPKEAVTVPVNIKCWRKS